MKRAYEDLFHGNRHARRAARKRLKRHFKALKRDPKAVYKTRKRSSRCE